MNRIARIAIAAAVGCCAIAFAYSAIHVLEVIFWPAPDPRTILVVQRIAFFWRSKVSLFVGVLVTIGAMAIQSRTPGWIDRRLPWVAIVTGVFTTAQGLFLP